MSLNIHQKITISIIAIVFVIFLYEEIFHLSLELFHILFECAEYVLDSCVEHLFDTTTHETQVIVFYVLVFIVVYASYQLYCFLLHRYNVIKANFQQQKIEALAQWQALSLIAKMLWYCFLTMLTFGYFLT